MKITYKILVILFLGSFFLSSCEEFFEIDDREKLTEELVLSKDNDVAAMWAYLYSNLELGFNQVQNAMLANACDEADLNSPFAAVQKFNEGSWNSVNNPDNQWNNLYSGIRNANKFLESTDTLVNERFNYKEYELVDPVKYAKLKRELKAYRIDARFILAYCHFELWKKYGNIPIVDELLTLGDSYKLTQSSSTDVVNYIVDLLDEITPEFAELEAMEGSEYLNGQWSGNYFGRVTKGATFALKCRTLLYAASPLNTSDGQYDKALCERAAQAAAEVINMGLYSTNIDYASIFTDKTAANPENILDNRTQVSNFNYLERWNYPLGGSDQWVTTGISTNATCPSQNLVDAYETLDGSPVNALNPYANRDPRFKQSILCNGDIFNDATVESFVGGKAGIGDKNATTTGYYLRKFIQEKLNLNINTTGTHVWFIFRYSEVLLNYAEAMYYAHGASATMAYVTNGSDLSAIDAINLIRGRQSVGMPPLSSLSEDQLRNERRIELAFEGHRFWDVRRWKIAEQTENEALKGMRITVDGSDVNYQVVDIENRKFTAPAMYRFPIPFLEMNNYPDWDQNTGW